MEDSVCGCVTCDSEEKTRWRTHSFVQYFVVVLMVLTIPGSHGLEDSHITSDSPVSFYWAEVNFTYIDPVTNKQVHESEMGRYGSKGLVEPRTGLVAHVRNKDNKTHGCDDYVMKIPKEKWIALVERGHCYFTDKITTATKKYNASAVVIYNSEPGVDKIMIMHHTVEDQVSIFVGKETGQKLSRLSDQGVRVIITITPGEKETTTSNNVNNISKTSVLFVSISFIVLMIISLAWLVFYYIQRFRYTHAKERLAKRLASAAKKAIAKIPQKTVKCGDKELDSEFDQCAVCIESYRPHDVIRTLPCRHVFHKSCVDPWLLDQRSCPMCKLDILRAYGMQVFGSQESVHHDPESGNQPVNVDPDPEQSSTIDETGGADTEVKVLLLPHTCLHFPPGQQPVTSDPGAAGPAMSGECHSPTCPSSSVRSSSSTDRLSRASSAHDSEMQALMAPPLPEEEEEDERSMMSGHHGSSDAREDEEGAGESLQNVPVVRSGSHKTAGRKRSKEDC